MRSKNRNILLQETLNVLDSFPIIGSEDYGKRVDELISNLQRVKKTLKSGPDRRNYRKEAAGLQRAIEALRYLGRKNSRLIVTESVEVDMFVNEYYKAQVGATVKLPDCDLTDALTNFRTKQGLSFDRDRAKFLSDMLGGFVPGYMCSALGGITTSVVDFFVRVEGEFEALFDLAFDGRSIFSINDNITSCDNVKETLEKLSGLEPTAISASRVCDIIFGSKSKNLNFEVQKTKFAKVYNNKKQDSIDDSTEQIEAKLDFDRSFQIFVYNYIAQKANFHDECNIVLIRS